jgi:RNA polymerase sigma-70 factor (ECF subfamily)
MIDDVELHIASLRRYAHMLCRNSADADDLVQEALTKALAAAHTYRSGKDLRAWLFSILHNTFVSQKRQYARRARAARFLDATSGEPETPENQEKHVEARDTLLMMSRLTPDQQSVLLLIAVEGYSYAEAAEVLDIPIGTLMSRLARGREMLRQLMSGEKRNQLRVVR